jgi:hypothetical protein
MQRLALVVVSLVGIVGCYQANPESCELPGRAGIAPCPPDAAPPDPSCKNDDGCVLTPDSPVCKIAGGVGSCVQCTFDKHDKCRDTSPLCGTDNRCTGCKKHADCDSNVCEPDGSCAMESEVAYVDGDTGTDQMICSKTMPCTQIEKAAMTMRPIVKVVGTVKQSARLDKSVTILADPNAAIALPLGDNGVPLEIRGNPNVTIKIYDLQITNSGNTNPAQGSLTLSEMANLELNRVSFLNNLGNAVAVTGGHLTCDQCSVLNNGMRGFDVTGGRITVTRSTIIDNNSSGFSVQNKGDFEIVGNIIFHNGDMNSVAAGGINIIADAQGPGDPPNRIEFNTLSENVAASASAQAIQCGVVTPMVARNNIVWGNGLDLATALQVTGNANCTFAFSDIGPIGTVPAGSNMTDYPQFQDPPPPGKLLHLMSTSPVRGKADPSSDLNGLAKLDIDGDPRVSRGAGMGADMGADQTP